MLTWDRLCLFRQPGQLSGGDVRLAIHSSGADATERLNKASKPKASGIREASTITSRAEEQSMGSHQTKRLSKFNIGNLVKFLLIVHPSSWIFYVHPL